MEQALIENDSHKVVTSASLGPYLQKHKKRVLIVEDDLAQRPLWDATLRSRVPEIQIDWATSEEGAEALVKGRLMQGTIYDLIVADIFLNGMGTGIDLWNRYGEVANEFVIVSVLPSSQFHEMMAHNQTVPMFVRKPLNTMKCSKVADLLGE